MVTRSVRIGVVVAGILRIAFELHVVVQQRWLFCVDRPLHGTGDLAGQAVTGQRVVERAPQAVKRIRQATGDFVVAVGIDVRDGVFLAVGIEVTDQQDIAVAGAGGVGAQPGQHVACGLHAGQVVVTLTIADIRIVHAALGLEVVDHHGEHFIIGIGAEGLRQRHTVAICCRERVIRHRVCHRRLSHERDFAGFVDDGGHDGVIARSGCVARYSTIIERPSNIGIGARTGHSVERIHQRINRAGAIGKTIVLYLHQAQNVGIHAQQVVNDLGLLACKFGCICGATTLVAGAVGIEEAGRAEGGEVVQHVGRGHFDFRPRYRGWQVRSGGPCCTREIGRNRWLNAVAGFVNRRRCRCQLIHHTNHAVHTIAAAQRIAGRQGIAAPPQVHSGVLTAAAVVQNDLVFLRGCCVSGVAAHAGRTVFGEIAQYAVGRERDCAVLAQGVVVGHHQLPTRCGRTHLDPHTLDRFPVDHFGHRQSDLHGRGQCAGISVIGDHLKARGCGQLRLAIELAHSSCDSHYVAHIGCIDACVGRVVVHKNAFRRSGVAIAIGGFFLNEKALQVGHVGGHDALDGDRLTVLGIGGARSLDG